MKLWLGVLLLALSTYCVKARGQTQISPISQVNWTQVTSNGAPSGGCPYATTASTSNLSYTVTVLSVNGLLENQTVVGSGIPTSTIVTAINTLTNQVTLSNAATATASGVTLSFYSLGRPDTDITGFHQYACTLSGWQQTSSSGGGTISPGMTNQVPQYTGTITLGPSLVSTDSSGDVITSGSYTGLHLTLFGAEGATGIAINCSGISCPFPDGTSISDVLVDTQAYKVNGVPLALSNMADVSVTPAVLGDNLTCVTLSGGACSAWAPGTGVGPIPANANFIFSGNSVNLDDDHVLSPAIVVSSYTAPASGVVTFTNTGTNGLSADDWVFLWYLTNWSSYSGASPNTGGGLFQVLSTGLSGTQFEVNVGSVGVLACPSSCGNAYSAMNFYPFVTTSAPQMPATALANTYIELPPGPTLQNLNTDYATVIHPFSPAVTGKPAYLIINNFENDIGLCDTVSNIEGYMASVFQKAHTDGFVVVATTGQAYNISQAYGAGFCTFPVAPQLEFFELAQWIQTLGKTDANAASGQYWDLLAPLYAILNDALNSNLIASNGGFGITGAKMAGGATAQAMITGTGTPMPQQAAYFGQYAGTGDSNGNGYVYTPSTDAIYAYQWLNSAANGWQPVMTLGTSFGYRFLTVNSDGQGTGNANTFNDADRGGSTAKGNILGVNETSSNSSALNNPWIWSYGSNQPTGSSPYWEYGHDQSTNNTIQMVFNYLGAGSTTNNGSLGLRGASTALQWDGNGYVYFPHLPSLPSSGYYCTHISPTGEITPTATDCGTGGSSPLTTKGDLWGYDTANDRIPVGSNGQVLTADSTQAFGVKWATPASAASVPTCADTSGSGTVQSCTTSPSFVPAAGSVIVYTTTTANTGTGLTINVNSLGAKSVAKWQNTTTLAAGDLAASSQVVMTYDGTNWEMGPIANAPSGGSSGNYVNLGSTVTWSMSSGSGSFANGVFTVGTPGPAITASSIPGTYAELIFQCEGRGSASNGGDDADFTFNGDTAGNYYVQRNYATNTTIATGSAQGQTSALLWYVSDASATANMSGGGSLSIQDYAGTTFTKRIFASGSHTTGLAAGNQFIYTSAGMWNSTAAITSITNTIGAGNYIAGSTCAIYGKN